MLFQLNVNRLFDLIELTWGFMSSFISFVYSVYLFTVLTSAKVKLNGSIEKYLQDKYLFMPILEISYWLVFYELMQNELGKYELAYLCPMPKAGLSKDKAMLPV